MAKFRTKPVLVEAEQFHAYLPLGQKWPSAVVVEDGEPPYVLTSPKCRVYVNNGDWIITKEAGYDVCSASKFEATYEAVE